MSQATSVLAVGAEGTQGTERTQGTGGADPTPAGAGAVKPGSTDNDAGAEGSALAALSTASLTAAIAAQLKGETVKSGARQSAATAQTGTAAGQEPSPAGGLDPNESSAAPAAGLAQGSVPEGSEGTEGTEEDEAPAADEHRLPPEAVKALAEERAKRRALKQKLAERDELLVTLQSNFTRLEAQIAGMKGATAEGSQGPERTEAGNGAHQSAATGHPELAKFDKAAAEIRKEMAQMDRNVAWAAANPDGGTLRDAKGNPQEVDAAYVAQWKQASEARKQQLQWDAMEALTQKAAREAALESEAQTQSRAMQQRAFAAYPWLKDQKSAEWKQAKKFMDENPGFDQVPNWPLLVGQIVTGKAPVANGRAAANGAPAGLPQAGSPAPLTGGRPTPQLPGATRALPARAAGGEPVNSSVLFNRMLDAKTEAERESAKAQWVKSLGRSLAA